MSTPTLPAARRHALPSAFLPAAALLLAALFILLLSPRPARAGTTYFSVTGQLRTSSAPPAAVPNGSYDLQFQLFSAATGGSQVGPTVSVPSVAVVSGIYYAQVDFGNVFGGQAYWVQVSYRLTGGGVYTLVSPRTIVPSAGNADYALLSGNTRAIQGKGILSTVPTTGQVLTYNGTNWAPSLIGASDLVLPLALSASNANPLLSVTNGGAGDALYGQSTGYGIGVHGDSSGYLGVYGHSGSGDGVYGLSDSGTGVYGYTSASGDYGFLGGAEPISGSKTPTGVFGDDSTGSGYGVYGASTGGYGVVGSSGGIGVYGTSTSTYGIGVYGASSNYAGKFDGNVSVSGTLKAGAKDFKIDHPLDPAHRYLSHASVESDEMKDVYDGNVTTDAQGNAVVSLPSWFQALNGDFRYQLTCLGQFAQAIVATKIQNNRFTIKTDKPNVEVSWQVTGVRHDAFALAHPLQVEQDKPKDEQGLYQNPEAFGLSEDKGIGDAERLKGRAND